VNAIVAIALNTFREAIRDRILYLILAFALVLIAVSHFVSLLTVGSEVKIVKDLGLSAISFFGLLTAVFVGVSLVFKEIERRTIYTLLAQPVRRWQFVCGKFAGLSLVLGSSVALTGAALLVAVALKGESPFGLVSAIVLTFIELELIAAFAVLFSSFTNPILAAVGTVATYVVGHLSWSFDLLEKRMTGDLGKAVCRGLHIVLPNLDRLNVKASAVHGLALPPGYFAWASVYGLSYALVIVILACLVFERREFV
jgi:ABC-type transport system involved in multi-copper enzyme maturation permease subunit